MNDWSAMEALAWQIWRRQNRSALVVVAVLGICGFGNLALSLGADQEWRRIGELFGYAGLAVVLILSFGCFRFTEVNRKGAGFPVRLFHLPVRTAVLVGVPMGLGVMVVVLVYAAGVLVIFGPLKKDLPVLWPCLYLAAGMAIYQAVVWKFAQNRYLKLTLLSFAAALLVFGWMFFLPEMIEGTLSDWGYTGSVRRFRFILMGALISCAPMAFGASVWEIGRQRSGEQGRAWKLPVVLEAWLAARRRGRIFASGSGAFFWHEWRQTGFILPVAVGVILIMTCVPSYLSSPLEGKVTMGLLGWMLAAPIVMSAIIGCGFSKPDFWRSDLRLGIFHAIRPISPGSWVLVKLKVAACSAGLTWGMVIYVCIQWLLLAGDLSWIDGWRWELNFNYSPLKQWMLLVAGLMLGVGLTWRLLVSGIAVGLWGRPKWYYLANAACAAGLVAILIMMVWIGDREAGLGWDWVWTGVEKLPGMLGLGVVVKSVLAGWAWIRADALGLVSRRTIILYFGGWVIGTGLLVGAVWMAVSDTSWLRHLMMLIALLAWPLASPAMGILALHQNRSR